MYIRYNCQRTCNSCRTQEVIDIGNAGQASGLSREAGGPDDKDTRETGSPGDDATSDTTAKVVTAVLVAVLAVAALGAAYLLRARRTSRFEKENFMVDLGWDNSAEAPWDNKRATVWHQDSSVAGTHFYPKSRDTLEGGLAAFEPVNFANSFAQVPPQHQPVGPAKFYPVSSKVNR